MPARSYAPVLTSFAIDDAIARVEAAVRRTVQSGDANAIALWNRTGGADRYHRRWRWWVDHREQFAGALR